jgi:hypothetical protein
MDSFPAIVLEVLLNCLFIFSFAQHIIIPNITSLPPFVSISISSNTLGEKRMNTKEGSQNPHTGQNPHMTIQVWGDMFSLCLSHRLGTHNKWGENNRNRSSGSGEIMETVFSHKGAGFDLLLFAFFHSLAIQRPWSPCGPKCRPWKITKKNQVQIERKHFPGAEGDVFEVRFFDQFFGIFPSSSDQPGRER